MPREYDRDNIKRLWPPAHVPRTTLQKVADVDHGGNTKKAAKSLHDKFAQAIEQAIADVEAEYAPKHEAHLTAKAQAEADKKAQKAAAAEQAPSTNGSAPAAGGAPAEGESAGEPMTDEERAQLEAAAAAA